jgi:hypothetical protein
LRPDRTRLSRRWACDRDCRFGGSPRTSLTTEAYDRLALFVLGLKIHHAGRWVVGKPEGEATAGVGSRLVPFVEGHGHLARLAQSAYDPQFAPGDHGLIDDDIGHGGRAAVDE